MWVRPGAAGAPVSGSEPSLSGSRGISVPLITWLPFLEEGTGRSAAVIPWCRGMRGIKPESGLAALFMYRQTSGKAVQSSEPQFFNK